MSNSMPFRQTVFAASCKKPMNATFRLFDVLKVAEESERQIPCCLCARRRRAILWHAGERVMPNPVLERAKAELARLGITGSVEHLSKHNRLSWLAPNGSAASIVFSATPNDWRGKTPVRRAGRA